MKNVLQGKPENTMPQPDGLVTVRINSETGLRARPDESGAIFEIFREETLPPFGPEPGTSETTSETVESLF